MEHRADPGRTLPPPQAPARAPPRRLVAVSAHRRHDAFLFEVDGEGEEPSRNGSEATEHRVVSRYLQLLKESELQQELR